MADRIHSGNFDEYTVVLSNKGAYLALMIVVIGLGIRTIIRFRTPFDRLSVNVVAVFLGHNAFLLFSYVVAFVKQDALWAASFWRYNIQVGLLAVVFTSYGLEIAWKTWRGGDRFKGW